MQVLVIALACVVTVLVLVWLFFRAAYVFGRLSGFEKLVTHYAYSGSPPPNARVRSFCVGLVGNSTGTAGSSENGLYLHGGLLGESVLIPWVDLRRVTSLGSFVMLRSRRTGVTLCLSNDLCKHLSAPQTTSGTG